MDGVRTKRKAGTLARLGIALAMLAGVLVIGGGLALYAVSRIDRGIVEPWHDPEARVFLLRGHELADGGALLINYFFDLSQEADLRRPRKGAWSKRTRSHRIAGGWVVELIDRETGAVTKLDCPQQIAYVREQGQRVWLLTAPDANGERKLFQYHRADGAIRVAGHGELRSSKASFDPVLDMLHADRARHAPLIEARIRKEFLHQPDGANFYRRPR